MAQLIRRMAVSGLGLAVAAAVAFAGTANAEDGVTVGGLVEVIGGSSDRNGKDADSFPGVDGLDRGHFSRIVVDYNKNLDNGLQISGDISYLLNSRANFAPDILSLSVGGGFGTITAGAAAAAPCALMPRVIAFVPGGVNATWYALFSGLSDYIVGSNTTFSEANYCGTPESVSYQTPTMGGFSAMVTYAPSFGSTQSKALKDAEKDNAAEGYFAAAGKFSSNLGSMSVDLGASFQRAEDDRIDSVSVAGIVSFGGASLGASWYDNGDPSTHDYPATNFKEFKTVAKLLAAGTANRSGTEGFNVGAKYKLGAITPAITYSSMKMKLNNGSVSGKLDGDDVALGFDLDHEATALAAGVSYAVGGGLTIFAEYMKVDLDYGTKNITVNGFTLDEGKLLREKADETLLMTGVIVSF